MAIVLAVDDSASIRMMVSLVLRQAGHQVLQAEDGVHALEVAKDNEVDVVIADVNMPRMDGITLVKKLREDPKHRFTPILMLTTECGDERKKQGREAGATGWMVKPFDPVRLLATVGKVLS